MNAFLLALVAATFASDVELQASVPTEIWVDGQPAAELYLPGMVRVDVPWGERQFRIFIQGVPNELTLQVPKDGRLIVTVGRNGITHASSDAAPAEETDAGPTRVEMLGVGHEEILLVIDGERHLLQPGGALSLELTRGDHIVTVRNKSGTVVWAQGTLQVRGRGPIIVQVAEGRMPEIFGQQGQFWSDAG